MSKPKHKASKHDHELAKWLRDRFYFIKAQGGQSFYYDSQTGVRSLTKTHLVQQLIEQGMKCLGGDVLGHGLMIIENAFLIPIVLEEVYRPSKPRIVNVQGNYHVNTWADPSVKPDLKISAKPFVDHLTRMLGSKEKADYVIDMVAYRYQTPEMQNDQKPHVAFYFYGSKHGYGKGIFAGTLEAVFGESAVNKVIDQSALNSMSAVDVWTRTWAIVEEVSVKKGSTDYNKLKTMIGGGVFNAARKGEHFRKHEAPAQLIMMSNHRPTFIEPNDRRFFISEWSTDFESEQDKNNYFATYIKWLKEQGGYSGIASLLATRDISHVRVEAPALMTEEKKAVIAVMTDRVVEAIKLIMEEQPEAMCFTADSFSRVWTEHDVSKGQQVHKLTEAGLVRTPKNRYKHGTHEFWIRQGWELRVKNGVTPALYNKSEYGSKGLYDDAGYIAAVNGRRAPDF
jgi:predicted transcriptional regulator